MSNSFKKRIVDKRWRSIIIMGFYVVLFGFLIIAIRYDKYQEKKELKRQQELEEAQKIHSTNDLQEYLKGTNYSFQYVLKLDDVTYQYVGKRYDDKQKLVIQSGMSNADYYIYGDIGLKKSGDEYILADLPFHYFNYFDIDIINNIINQSTYDELTNTYEITSSNFNEAIKQKATMSNKSINTISIAYTDNNISAIIIDFSNYVKARREKYSFAVLELKYQDFGKITDFSIE